MPEATLGVLCSCAVLYCTLVCCAVLGRRASGAVLLLWCRCWCVCWCVRVCVCWCVLVCAGVCLCLCGGGCALAQRAGL